MEQLLAMRTSRRFISSRLTADVEITLQFIAMQVWGVEGRGLERRGKEGIGEKGRREVGRQRRRRGRERKEEERGRGGGGGGGRRGGEVELRACELVTSIEIISLSISCYTLLVFAGQVWYAEEIPGLVPEEGKGISLLQARHCSLDLDC